MADISKVILPSGDEYDFKDATVRQYLNVLQTKTYTGVLGTASNFAGAAFFYGKILPKDYNAVWTIRGKMYMEATGDYRAKASSDFIITGAQSAVLAYSIFNSFTNTSYRPVSYHEVYRATSAGIENEYGHLLGFGIHNAWNITTAARTVTIDILCTDNCTFEFFDSVVKYADAPGTGETNYSALSELNFSTNGLQETGDNNNYDRSAISYIRGRLAAPLYRYELLLTKTDGTLLPVNSENNVTAKTKTLTTDSFDPFGEIYYYSSTATAEQGAYLATSVCYRQIPTPDLRYAFNCGGYASSNPSTLTGGKPLYLVAVPQSDGSAKLHSEPLAQDLPSTEDGLIYIFLGYVYNDTYPYRLGELAMKKTVYYYHNGKIREFTGADDLVYAVATTSANGLMSSSDKASLDDLVANALKELNIMSYGSSTYAECLAAYKKNSVIYCRASSNTNPATGSQNRLAFLAYVNDATTPTEFEFQYYRSVATHSDSQQGDQVYIYKLKSSTGWESSVREAYTKVVAGTSMSSSYSSGKITLNHENSGVTAASKGDTTAQTPSWGGTFKALSGTVNATGHLTAFGEHTVTIPNSTASSSAAGLMSSADKSALDSLSENVGSHTVASDVPANAVFTDTTYTGTSPISISGTGISHAASGVTAASKGDTSNQTPGFGSTFKVLSGTVNATGHLTAFAEHTVKIPNAAATTSAAGLMSATDKSTLNNLGTRVTDIENTLANIDLSDPNAALYNLALRVAALESHALLDSGYTIPAQS